MSTSNDDEREALDYAIRCAIPNDLDYRPLWKLIRAIQDAVLAAGFRRSEVPEPSVECPKCGVRATGQTPSTFYTHHDETCDGALEEPQGEPSFEVPEPSTDARCCAHVKCPSGSLCCCIDEAPGASACVCLPAIAGISDGPNVDCPEHGERLDVAVLREAWVHYTAVGASVEVQEQKAAVFDRWIAGPRVEPSCDYEAGYAEGFHHGVSTPRGSAENDREQGEPSDAQVEAALIAHLGYDPAPAGFPFKDVEKDQMRAALRAAEEA